MIAAQPLSRIYLTNRRQLEKNNSFKDGAGDAREIAVAVQQMIIDL
jgi:hypothetical protein